MKRIDHTIDYTHSDFKLLMKIFEKPDLRSSSSSSKDEVIIRHYIRESGFRYWDTEQGQAVFLKIHKRISDFNRHSKKYSMYIESTTDYEVDIDNDRSWPPSWTCGFKLKK